MFSRSLGGGTDYVVVQCNHAAVCVPLDHVSASSNHAAAVVEPHGDLCGPVPTLDFLGGYIFFCIF